MTTDNDESHEKSTTVNTDDCLIGGIVAFFRKIGEKLADIFSSN